MSIVKESLRRTVLVFLEKQEKFAINKLKDLERFAETKGRTMRDFDFEMADNEQILLFD